MIFDLTSDVNFNTIVLMSVFLISIIGTKMVILTLRNKIAEPDIALITGKRKAPLPKNGGIALVFAIIMGFLSVDSDYTIIALIFLLTGIPLLGSVMPLPRIIRLAIRFVIVLIAISTLPHHIFSSLLPPLLDKTLAVVLWLWIIHSFDKLDVVEGLVAVEIISIGIGISILAFLSEDFFSLLSIQSSIFAMAGIGFLWWNYFPAKVLAGEIGRVPAGFIAGYLLLLATSQGYYTVALTLPAYFLADSFVMFFNRPFAEKFISKQNTKPQPPYCLRAIKNSYAPKWIIRTIAGINIFLVFLETQTLISPQMLFFNLFIAYAMVFALIWHFSRKNTGYHL